LPRHGEEVHSRKENNNLNIYGSDEQLPSEPSFSRAFSDNTKYIKK